jgi:hypothetical protein
MTSSSPVDASKIAPRNRASGPRRSEDLVYVVVTVAAMVSMLASAWVF